MKRSSSLFLSLLLFVAQAALALDQTEIQNRYDDIELRSPETKVGLSREERKALLDEVAAHPVASLAQVGKYDPPPGEIGFCFGRSTTAHLLARKKGVARNGILKLFIAGDMTPGPNQRWRFHVTTLVRDELGQNWYSIDPVIQGLGHPEPLLPKDWIKAARQAFDPKLTTKNYITTSESIMVDMREVPAVVEVENNERIIEVNFNPDRAGFELEREVGELGEFKVYRVDADAQGKYFIKRQEAKVEDDFSFIGLSVKIITPTQVIPREYNYNGYFSDLLTSMAN